MPWRSGSLVGCACAAARRHAASAPPPRTQRVAARHIRHASHWRVPVLAALSASHHQTVGKPAAAVFRQRIGPAEAIPARGAALVVGELRHDVVVPQQHAVERLGRGDELGAILGEDHPLDQRIDRRILDADVDCASPACRPPASSRSRAARCRATAIAARRR